MLFEKSNQTNIILIVDFPSLTDCIHSSAGRAAFCAVLSAVQNFSYKYHHFYGLSHP
jgi:hypothetical protein